MLSFLARIFGTLMAIVYDLISKVGTEPANFSYYAMSIILMTLIIKIILLPLSVKQIKNTKKMNEIQPEMEEIQRKYKDPQSQSYQLQQLYKKHNYNPMSGCLPALIQFPIIIGLYRMFQQPTTFVFDPEVYAAMNKTFLWIPNLELPDPFFWGLPLLAAAVTLLQNKVMMPKQPSGSGKKTAAQQQTESMQSTMTIMLPVMIFISARQFSAGIALYWVVQGVLTIIQHLLIQKLA